MAKCVFLDRDGVLNEDSPNYVFQPAHFHVLPGVPDALAKLKQAGYLLIVITNQSGIAQGLYPGADMDACHKRLHQDTNGLIDHIYFSPQHPSVSASLTRKPESLLFEKAMARFGIDPSTSWMIGDRERDLLPAKKLGLKTMLITDLPAPNTVADYCVESLSQTPPIIIKTLKD